MSEGERTPWVWVGVILALIAIPAVAYFVWPTQWESHHERIRQNRFTGQHQFRLDDGEWEDITVYEAP